MKTAYTLNPQQSQLIDLVRRLEKDGYDFGVDIDSVEQAIKTQNSTTLDKIYLRAQALDDGTLSQALRHTLFRRQLLVVLLTLFAIAINVVLAVVVLWVLFGFKFLSVFYLLPVFIVVHTLFFVRSLLDNADDSGEPPFESLFDRTSPQDEIGRYAYAIIKEQQQKNSHWSKKALTQLRWLFVITGLMAGVLIGNHLYPELFI